MRRSGLWLDGGGLQSVLVWKKWLLGDDRDEDDLDDLVVVVVENRKGRGE